MSDRLSALIHEEAARLDVPAPRAGEVLARGRRLRQRRRIRDGAVGLAAAAAVGTAIALPPGNESDTAPVPPATKDIFADVRGWIAYGVEERGGWMAGEYEPGIWAADPTQPDRQNRVRLSSEPGTPRAWSADGSKLLVLRVASAASENGDWELVVLESDGTETLVVRGDEEFTGGSFSADGTEVVYASGILHTGLPDTGSPRASAIFVVDAEGGTPRLLRTPRRGLGAYVPTFSPDGTQIAYVEGHWERHGQILRVMNADGSGDRRLAIFGPLQDRGIDDLAWSPDGSRLALYRNGVGIWVVGADGSGLTQVIDQGRLAADWDPDPHWSPDGSRLSYNAGGQEVWTDGYGSSGGRPDDPLTALNLEIAHWDGTQVQKFGHHARSGPWNPLDPQS